jgi:uncharacterized protein YktA (UPF0223 family)
MGAFSAYLKSGKFKCSTSFKQKMAQLVMKIVIDVEEYEQLKLAASKLAESEKIIKEHLKIKAENNQLTKSNDKNSFVSEENEKVNRHSYNT